MGIVYATSSMFPGRSSKSKPNAMGIDPREAPFGVNHPCDKGGSLGASAESQTVDLQGIEARVDRVNVDGVVRTKPDIIRQSVKELFQANNFEDMIHKAHQVRGKLQNLGIFRNVAIHIDTSSGPKATPNGYEVTYEVVEMKRIFGGVTSQVANHGEAALVVNGVMPNLFGRAEELRAEYKYGSNRTNTVGCSLMKPLIFNRNPVITFSAFKNDSEWPMSGYKVIDKALQLDFAFNSYHKLKHNIQYEADWRQIGAGNRYAAFEVREDSGHTLKSALKHIATLDYRDSKVFPTCGSIFKVTSEFSGLGGNVSFVKNEGNLQFNIPVLTNDLVFQMSFNLGHMMELEGGGAAVCDNFFLGGPLSLRAFEFRSVGPAKDANFTGGKAYWSSGLHLYTPLPFRPGSGGFGDLFRSHFWINCGNCGEWSIASAEEWSNQLNTARLAAGLGVAFRVGQMARVELNYCFPIRFQDSDKKVDGVQFGIGMHFL